VQVPKARTGSAGNWREEHVFALRQAQELYDVYHTKVVECDLRIEVVLRRLRDAAAKPVFLTGIAAMASPLSSAQQPMGVRHLESVGP
jgi:hypothetical protein